MWWRLKMAYAIISNGIDADFFEPFGDFFRNKTQTIHIFSPGFCFRKTRWVIVPHFWCYFQDLSTTVYVTLLKSLVFDLNSAVFELKSAIFGFKLVNFWWKKLEIFKNIIFGLKLVHFKIKWTIFESNLTFSVEINNFGDFF